LDKTTIYVDKILYLSLYYLVNDLVHLPNPTIRSENVKASDIINNIMRSWDDVVESPTMDLYAEIPKVP